MGFEGVTGAAIFAPEINSLGGPLRALPSAPLRPTEDEIAPLSALSFQA